MPPENARITPKPPFALEFESGGSSGGQMPVPMDAKNKKAVFCEALESDFVGVSFAAGILEKNPFIGDVAGARGVDDFCEDLYQALSAKNCVRGWRFRKGVRSSYRFAEDKKILDIFSWYSSSIEAA